MNQQKKKIIWVFVGGVAILFLFWLGWCFSAQDIPTSKANVIQAVFLSDGQVYFGKIENHNHRFAKLRNVYYLKQGSALQQDSEQGASVSSQNLNLVKLGGEVHGPEDEMFIAKDKILFIENLKGNSAVVAAIKKNLK